MHQTIGITECRVVIELLRLIGVVGYGGHRVLVVVVVVVVVALVTSCVVVAAVAGLARGAGAWLFELLTPGVATDREPVAATDMADVPHV
eukprot:16154020-Heterocapsa_arctica.AAC.1